MDRKVPDARPCGTNCKNRRAVTARRDEIRNTDIHRTRRHAAGILAIQAAGRFERGFLDIITKANQLGSGLGAGGVPMGKTEVLNGAEHFVTDGNHVSGPFGCQVYHLHSV